MISLIYSTTSVSPLYMSYIKSLAPSTISLAVHAKPGAKISKIVSCSSDVVDIALQARAVEGAANSELVDFLSSLFKVKKRDVLIVSGEKARWKTVKISGVDEQSARKAIEVEMAVKVYSIMRFCFD